MEPEPLLPYSIVPGRRLDRYEMLCPLAEGGMASVWIARLTGGLGFEKIVAVKTILPRFAEDPRFQKMFIQETRIASRIDHLNVTQILDVGEEDNVTFLVMEYVDGDSLSTIHRMVQKRGELIPPGVVLRVMADVCGGLHAAHELRNDEGSLLRVVHRDVSPQNVLVNTRGMAKLIDFGIAKARDQVMDDEVTGPLKGKIRYMAPEQARGEPIDRRADVWAVGAVLSHLLSGRPPYEGHGEMETLAMLRDGQPPEIPASIHPAIASVVARALAPSPGDRFAMATELQRAIENAMVEADVQTSASGVATFVAEHTIQAARRRKSIIDRALKAMSERQSTRDCDSDPTPVRAGSVPGVKTWSTMRPASIETVSLVAPAARSRLYVLAGACAAVGVAAVAIVLASHSAAAPSVAALPKASPSFAAAIAPGPTPSTAQPPDVPTLDVNQLPIASADAPPAPPPAPVMHAPVPFRAAPPAPPKRPARVRIDDGF